MNPTNYDEFKALLEKFRTNFTEQDFGPSGCKMIVFKYEPSGICGPNAWGYIEAVFTQAGKFVEFSSHD